MTLLLPAAALGLLIPATTLRAQDAEFRLHLLTPSVELTWRSEFDAAVLLDAAVDGARGWSFGVTHDAAALELVEAAIGADAAVANGGEAPEFAVLNTAPVAGGTGFTQAVVLNLEEGVTLPAGDDQELATAHYRVIANPADSIPCATVTTTLDFSDALVNDAGSPPVRTVVTVAGETRIPERVPGDIAVRCPGTIEMTRCEGDTGSVHLEWEFGGAPDWDFLFLYRDGVFRDLLDVGATTYTDEDLAAGDYEYTILTFVVDDPTSPSLLFARCVATVTPVTVTGIEPAVGDWLGGDLVTISGTAFTTAEATTVSFTAAGEDPLPLEVVEVLSSTRLTARTPAAPRLGRYGLLLENDLGTAERTDTFEYGFVRGEVNAAGPIDLSDAVYLLDFLFVGKVGAPRCEDAADVNDDGTLDISDATSILAFLFQGGAPPAAPFPDPGADPTGDDSLGCLP